MKSITALFAPIERFITEHGSAAIQEKHISLLKEQFSIVLRENEKLTSENTVLKTKIETLETENQNLKQENINLKKIIEEHDMPPCSVSSVESPEEIPSWKKIRKELKSQI
jgi:regulator of replication initiation timing